MPSKYDIDKKRLLSRRTFAAKSFAAQTDWLEAPFCDGATTLLYEENGTRYEINGDLLARTQRQLYKLRQDCEAVEKALGDSDAWFERRQRLLDEVKVLHGLKLQQQAFPFDKPDLNQNQMMNQLVIAAMTNSVGGNVGTAIAERGSDAAAALIALMADQNLPMLSRTMAAMVLGTIHGAIRTERLPEDVRIPSILAAYKFGATNAFDERAPLYNRLLLAKDGTSLVARARAAWSAARWNYLIDEKALQWIASGASPAKLIEFLENLSRIEAMRKRLQTIMPSTDAAQRELAETLSLCVHIAMDGRDSEALVVTCDMFEKFFEVLNGRRLKPKDAERLTHSLCVLPHVAETVPQHLRSDCLRLIERACRKLETDKEHSVKASSALVNELTPHFAHDFLSIGKLLNWSSDAHLVGRAVDAQVAGALADHQDERIDADTLSLVLQVVTALGIDRCANVMECLSTVRACRGNPRSRTELLQIVVLLKSTKYSGHNFLAMLEILRLFPKISVRQGIAIFAEMLPPLMAKLLESEKMQLNITRSLATFCLLTRSCQPEASASLMTLVAECLVSKTYKEYWSAVNSALYLATYLCDGDERVFRQVYECSVAKRLTLDVSDELLCLRPLLGLPRVRENVRRAFIHHPGSCVSLVAQARLAAKLQLSLELICKPLEKAESDIECICENCRRVAELPDEARSYWAGYVQAQRACEEPHELPHSVTKWLDMSAKLSKELHYLEKQHPPANRPVGVEQRIAKLRFYKQFPRTMEAEVNMHVRKELEKTEANAVMHAAERLVKRAIENNSSREQLDLLGLTRDQLFDLVVLRTSLDKSRNRGELKRLLSACARGDLQWPHRQTANREFLKRMREQGLDADVWLEGFHAYVTVTDVDAKALRISVEQNPIEILKMGAYFDTCLSLDGVNAFSSIANATDLNKRVIYLRNALGEPLARKLIAVTDEWKLVGFDVYFVERIDDEHRTALGAAVDQFALELARRVGIELAKKGHVPTLVSKSWYDDGAITWKPDEDFRELPTLCFGEKRIRPNQ